MKKVILGFLLLGAVNCNAQSTAAGNAWGAPRFLGFNTSNGVNPLFIKTNDITRMRINGIQSTLGINTSGFIGIGPNGFFNTNSPWANL